MWRDDISMRVEVNGKKRKFLFEGTVSEWKIIIKNIRFEDD